MKSYLYRIVSLALVFCLLLDSTLSFAQQNRTFAPSRPAYASIFGQSALMQRSIEFPSLDAAARLYPMLRADHFRQIALWFQTYKDQADSDALEALTQKVDVQNSRGPRWLGKDFKELKRTGRAPSREWLENEMWQIARRDAHDRHTKNPKPLPSNVELPPGERLAALRAMGWDLRLTYYPFQKARTAFNDGIRWGYTWVHERSKTRVQIGSTLVVDFGYITRAQREQTEADYKAPIRQANFSERYLLTCLTIIRQAQVLKVLLEQPEFSAKEHLRDRVALLGMARLTVGENYPSTLRILNQKIGFPGLRGGPVRLRRRHFELTMEVLRRLADQGLEMGERKMIPTWFQILAARSALAQRLMLAGNSRGWAEFAELSLRYRYQFASFLKRTVSTLHLFGVVQDPFRVHGMPLNNIQSIAAIGDHTLLGAHAILDIQVALAKRGVDISSYRYSAVDAAKAALDLGERSLVELQKDLPAEKRIQVAKVARDVREGLPWDTESQDIVVTSLLGSLDKDPRPVSLPSGKVLVMDPRLFHLAEINRVLAPEGYVQILVDRDMSPEMRHAFMRFGFTAVTEPNAPLRYSSFSLLRLFRRPGRIKNVIEAFDRLRSRFYGSSHIVLVKTGPTLTEEDLRVMARDQELTSLFRAYSDVRHGAPQDVEDQVDSSSRRQPKEITWGRLAFNQLPATEAEPTGINRLELLSRIESDSSYSDFQKLFAALIWAAGNNDTLGYLSEQEIARVMDFSRHWNNPEEFYFSRAEIQWILKRALQAARRISRSNGHSKDRTKIPHDSDADATGSAAAAEHTVPVVTGPTLLDVFEAELRSHPELIEIVSVELPAEPVVTESIADDIPVEPPPTEATANSTEVPVVAILNDAAELSNGKANLPVIAAGDVIVRAPEPKPVMPLTPVDLAPLVKFIESSLDKGQWVLPLWNRIAEKLVDRGHPLMLQPPKIKTSGWLEAYQSLYAWIDALNASYLKPEGLLLVFQEKNLADKQPNWNVGIVALGTAGPMRYSVSENGRTLNSISVYNVSSFIAGPRSASLNASTRIRDNGLAPNSGPNKKVQYFEQDQRRRDLIESASNLLIERLPRDKHTPPQIRWPAIPFVEKYLKPWSTLAVKSLDHAAAQKIMETFRRLTFEVNTPDSAEAHDKAVKELEDNFFIRLEIDRHGAVHVLESPKQRPVLVPEVRPPESSTEASAQKPKESESPKILKRSDVRPLFQFLRSCFENGRWNKDGWKMEAARLAVLGVQLPDDVLDAVRLLTLMQQTARQPRDTERFFSGMYRLTTSLNAGVLWNQGWQMQIGGTPVIQPNLGSNVAWDWVTRSRLWEIDPKADIYPIEGLPLAYRRFNLLGSKGIDPRHILVNFSGLDGRKRLDVTLSRAITASVYYWLGQHAYDFLLDHPDEKSAVGLLDKVPAQSVTKEGAFPLFFLRNDELLKEMRRLATRMPDGQSQVSQIFNLGIMANELWCRLHEFAYSDGLEAAKYLKELRQRDGSAPIEDVGSALFYWTLIRKMPERWNQAAGINVLIPTPMQLLDPEKGPIFLSAVKNFFKMDISRLQKTAKEALQTDWAAHIEMEPGQPMRLIDETGIVRTLPAPPQPPAAAEPILDEESTQKNSAIEDAKVWLAKVQKKGLEGLEAAKATIFAVAYQEVEHAPDSLKELITDDLMNQFIAKPGPNAISRALQKLNLFDKDKLTGHVVLAILNELNLIPAPGEKPAFSSQNMTPGWVLGVELIANNFRIAFELGPWEEQSWKDATAGMAGYGPAFPSELFRWDIEDVIAASKSNDKQEYHRLLRALVENINSEYLLDHGYRMDVEQDAESKEWTVTTIKLIAWNPHKDDDPLPPEIKGSVQQKETIQSLRRFLVRSFRHGYLDPDAWTATRQKLSSDLSDRNLKTVDDLVSDFKNVDRSDRPKVFAYLNTFMRKLNTTYLLHHHVLIEVFRGDEDWEIDITPILSDRTSTRRIEGLGDFFIFERADAKDVKPRVSYQTDSIILYAPNLGAGLKTVYFSLAATLELSAQKQGVGFLGFADRYLRSDNFLGLYYAEAPPEDRALTAKAIASSFAYAHALLDKESNVQFLHDLLTQYSDTPDHPLPMSVRLLLIGLLRVSYRLIEQSKSDRLVNDSQALLAAFEKEISSHAHNAAKLNFLADRLIASNFYCLIRADKGLYALETQKPGSPVRLSSAVEIVLTETISRLITGHSLDMALFKRLDPVLSEQYGDLGESLRAEAHLLAEPPTSLGELDRDRQIHLFIRHLNYYLFNQAKHVINYQDGKGGIPARVNIWPVMPEISSVWNITGNGVDPSKNQILVASVDSDIAKDAKTLPSASNKGIQFYGRLDRVQNAASIGQIHNLLKNPNPGLADEAIGLVRYWIDAYAQGVITPRYILIDLSCRVAQDLAELGPLPIHGKLESILERPGAKWKNIPFSSAMKSAIAIAVFSGLNGILNDRGAPGNTLAYQFLSFLTEKPLRQSIPTSANVAVLLELLSSVISGAPRISFQILDYDPTSGSSAHIPSMTRLAKAASQLSNEDWVRIAKELLHDSFDRYLVIDPIKHHIDVYRLDAAA